MFLKTCQPRPLCSRTVVLIIYRVPSSHPGHGPTNKSPGLKKLCNAHFKYCDCFIQHFALPFSALKTLKQVKRNFILKYFFVDLGSAHRMEP